MSDVHTFNLEIAEAIAPGWERRREFIEETAAPVRRWLIEQLAPREGETLLELAAGIGDTGFEAAERLGETGELITSDLSPSMLEAARRRGCTLGRDNVEYLVMDAEHMPLDTDSVDGVICRYGLMLMDNPFAALTEARRVLREGGRLALAVWGAPRSNPYFAAIVAALVAHGRLEPPEPTAPGVFSLADPSRLTELLRAVGFRDIHTEPITVTFRVSDVAEYLEIISDTAGPIGLTVRALGDSDRRSIAADLEQTFATFADGDELAIPGQALGASAR